MSTPNRFFAVINLPGHTNIGGKVFGCDPPPTSFPEGSSGDSGPFDTPTATPPRSTKKNPNFDDWVNYYVQYVGSKVEVLNGLQFSVTRGTVQQTAKTMSKELAKLADALNVGSPKNPKQLRWPLAGSYTLKQKATKMGFGTFFVDLYFDNEPTDRLVVNCTIQVTATPPGSKRPGSSGSSYIATSSK